MEKISLIIPCFNEEEVLPILYGELNKVAVVMDKERFEFIFVDDGSKDETLKIIKSFEDKRVKFISFSRNFGKEAAMLAGLKAASGDYVAIMDADMQDPPSLLPEMLQIIKEKGVDSVATRRFTRKGEPPIRSFFANIFYRVFNKASGLDVKSGSRDFRLMTRKMADAVISLPEDERFSKGIFEWVGFKTEWIAFKNVERAKGKTKWSFKKLLKYGVNGSISFQTALLKLSYVFGLLSVCGGIGLGIHNIILAANNMPVGYGPVIITMLLIGGIIMLLLGIIGEYLGKIFNSSRGRPQYIIKEENVER